MQERLGGLRGNEGVTGADFAECAGGLFVAVPDEQKRVQEIERDAHGFAGQDAQELAWQAPPGQTKKED